MTLHVKLIDLGVVPSFGFSLVWSQITSNILVHSDSLFAWWVSVVIDWNQFEELFVTWEVFNIDQSDVVSFRHHWHLQSNVEFLLLFLIWYLYIIENFEFLNHSSTSCCWVFVVIDNGVFVWNTFHFELDSKPVWCSFDFVLLLPHLDFGSVLEVFRGYLSLPSWAFSIWIFIIHD